MDPRKSFGRGPARVGECVIAAAAKVRLFVSVSSVLKATPTFELSWLSGCTTSDDCTSESIRRRSLQLWKKTLRSRRIWVTNCWMISYWTMLKMPRWSGEDSFNVVVACAVAYDLIRCYTLPHLGRMAHCDVAQNVGLLKRYDPS